MKCEKEGYLKFIPRKLRPALRNFRLLNRNYGHFRTMRTSSSVDARGEPIPWYTYPAVEYVKQLDFRGKTIFEYGSGNSTLFYAARCGRITAVEDQRGWWERISPRSPSNCEIRLVENAEEYPKTILSLPGPFDLIIIDGSHRERCCEVAVPKLAPNGFIILDNSDQLKDCVKILAREDFIQVDFAGFGPLNGYIWATSFFFRRGFNFPHVHPHQPTLSVGP